MRGANRTYGGVHTAARARARRAQMPVAARAPPAPGMMMLTGRSVAPSVPATKRIGHRQPVRTRGAASNTVGQQGSTALGWQKRSTLGQRHRSGSRRRPQSARRARVAPASGTAPSGSLTSRLRHAESQLRVEREERLRAEIKAATRLKQLSKLQSRLEETLAAAKTSASSPVTATSPTAVFTRLSSGANGVAKGPVSSRSTGAATTSASSSGAGPTPLGAPMAVPQAVPSVATAAAKALAAGTKQRAGPMVIAHKSTSHLQSGRSAAPLALWQRRSSRGADDGATTERQRGQQGAAVAKQQTLAQSLSQLGLGGGAELNTTKQSQKATSRRTKAARQTAKLRTKAASRATKRRTKATPRHTRTSQRRVPKKKRSGAAPRPAALKLSLRTVDDALSSRRTLTSGSRTTGRASEAGTQGATTSRSKASVRDSTKFRLLKQLLSSSHRSRFDDDSPRRRKPRGSARRSRTRASKKQSSAVAPGTASAVSEQPQVVRAAPIPPMLEWGGPSGGFNIVHRTANIPRAKKMVLGTQTIVVDGDPSVMSARPKPSPHMKRSGKLRLGNFQTLLCESAFAER